MDCYQKALLVASQLSPFTSRHGSLRCNFTDSFLVKNKWNHNFFDQEKEQESDLHKV